MEDILNGNNGGTEEGKGENETPKVPDPKEPPTDPEVPDETPETTGNEIKFATIRGEKFGVFPSLTKAINKWKAENEDANIIRMIYTVIPNSDIRHHHVGVNVLYT